MLCVPMKRLATLLQPKANVNRLLNMIIARNQIDRRNTKKTGLYSTYVPILFNGVDNKRWIFKPESMILICRGMESNLFLETPPSMEWNEMGKLTFEIAINCIIMLWIFRFEKTRLIMETVNEAAEKNLNGRPIGDDRYDSYFPLWHDMLWLMYNK